MTFKHIRDFIDRYDKFILTAHETPDGDALGSEYAMLKARPGELITTGFFRLSRNPNYFGELLIYLGFGLLAMSWIPIVVIAGAMASFWIPRMVQKDRSLARYPEFAYYKKRTAAFIPYLI